MKITEAATLTATTGSRWRARLIQAPVQGSSGYYPVETIRRDGPTTWPASTPIYFDHPSASERADRPERSVRDLAGKIVSTPVMESDGLYADVQFYSWAADVVREMGPDIGLSIRASAEASSGEVDGKPATIITALHEGLSVDLVTKAGAGGKLISVLESARKQPDHEVSERLSRDRRDQVQRAVQAAWATDERYPWLADFDDTAHLAYFETGGKTWQQSYTVAADDMSVTMTGERTEVRPVTTYHPVVAPAGATTTTQEAAMPQIEEARLAELTESANRVPALETERDAAIKRAEAAEALVAEAARDAYTNQVTAAVEAANLPTPAAQRVTAALTLAEGADVPDSPAQVIKEAVEAEQAYIRSLTAGATRKLGFGSATPGRQVAESYTNPWGRTINTQEA